MPHGAFMGRVLAYNEMDISVMAFTLYPRPASPLSGLLNILIYFT